MTVRELIEKLERYNQDAQVRLLGYTTWKDSPEAKDAFEDFEITDVHDHFQLEGPHSMVSLEFALEIVETIE